MSYISDYIEKLNTNNRKALTIFLTAGYPSKDTFADLAVKIIDAGADILEIGVPFGDSLADGPVVQSSYIDSLERGVELGDVFRYVKEIKQQRDNPIIIMSAANPLTKFGKARFAGECIESGADGLIIPDIPIEEHADFFTSDFDTLDKIILTTPTSPAERIARIDNQSSGFVYCVSVVGTTGIRKNFDTQVIENLKRTYSLVSKNKMLIGFGISDGKSVESFKPYCDGVIVGSAVLRALEKENYIESACELVSELSDACRS
jgi:tryptophan synthase alpha chain